MTCVDEWPHSNVAYVLIILVLPVCGTFWPVYGCSLVQVQASSSAYCNDTNTVISIALKSFETFETPSKTHQNKRVNQITNIAVVNSCLFKQDYKSTVLNDGATVQ